MRLKLCLVSIYCSFLFQHFMPEVMAKTFLTNWLHPYFCWCFWSQKGVSYGTINYRKYKRKVCKATLTIWHIKMQNSGIFMTATHLSLICLCKIILWMCWVSVCFHTYSFPSDNDVQETLRYKSLVLYCGQHKNICSLCERQSSIVGLLGNFFAFQLSFFFCCFLQELWHTCGHMCHAEY